MKKNKDYFGFHRFSRSPLTNGNEYTLLKVEVEGSNVFYRIKNDFGWEQRFHSTMFITKSEHRHNQLNRLFR